MIKAHCETKISRNFSIAMVWINGGSNMDIEEKKGINQILCSLLSRGCKGFENLAAHIKIVKKIKGIPLYNGILKKLSIRNLNPIKIIYSFLIAIIGSNFEALNAG